MNNQILVQAVVPGMKKAGYGRIINIISTSVKTPLAGLGVSNTIRLAVASWAKTLANEIARFNITVNNILPGLTETQRLDELLKHTAVAAGQDQSFIEEQMKQIGSHETIREAGRNSQCDFFPGIPCGFLCKRGKYCC